MASKPRSYMSWEVLCLVTMPAMPGSWPRRLHREQAVAVVLGCEQPRLELQQAVANHRLLDRRPAAQLGELSEKHQAVEGAAHEVGSADEGSLVLEGRAAHAPPFTALANDAVLGNADVFEEDLGEVRLPGHLTEGANVDAGGLHVDQ